MLTLATTKWYFNQHHRVTGVKRISMSYFFLIQFKYLHESVTMITCPCINENFMVTIVKTMLPHLWRPSVSVNLWRHFYCMQRRHASPSTANHTNWTLFLDLRQTTTFQSCNPFIKLTVLSLYRSLYVYNNGESWSHSFSC